MTDSTEKKYAGKFDTIEALEEGYKNAAKVYQSNEDLKRKVDELSMVPDDYRIPAGISDSDHITRLKGMARSGKLTQQQFEELAKKSDDDSRLQQENFERNKSALGEERLNVLKDYVNKNYPEEIHQIMLDKIIDDEKIRNGALKHRDKLLNTSVPGGGHVPTTGSSSVSYEDVLKSREALMKSPHDLKLKDDYIRKTELFANSKVNA